MEKNAIIAICVVAVLAVAGGAAGFIILNNNDNGDPSGETYWYYIYFEADNPKNGWYSATATNASDGFRNAMDAANMTYKLSSRGYVGEIDGVGTSWWHGLYLYSDYSTTAQEHSVLFPVTSTMGLSYSNGWKMYAGYNTDGGDDLKLYQANVNVWYLTPYIVEDKTYSAVTPDKVNDWMNDGPFKTVAPTKTQTYSFYLYFGEGDSRNNWYSASATNAGEAFDKAMKDAGFKYELGGGYLSSVDGEGNYWWLGSYIFSQVDKDAQNNSISSASFAYGSLQTSKGWNAFNGYDLEGFDGFKISQSISTIWFMSIYGNEGAPSLTDEQIASGWMNSGPFATA